jgi:hypothetical protein
VLHEARYNASEGGAMKQTRFSTWLQQHLATTGLSIAEVARRYGNRSYQIVWKYTQGIHAPSEAHVDEFATAIGAEPNTVRELLGYPIVIDAETDLQRMMNDVLTILRPLSAGRRAAVVAVATETARQLTRL